MMGLRVLLPLLVIVLGASAQTDRIKLATLAPRGSSYHKALLEMGQKWRQYGVALTIYADGVQGGESVVVQKLRAGQLQAGMLTVTGLSDIDPAVAALQNMPMMFRSLDEVDYIRQKLTPTIEKRFQEKGFVILFWGDAGWVRFFSRRPAVRPADLKSQKMFVWQGDNTQVDLMKGYGYQPVPLETSDIYTSLQTGMIDAVPSIPYYALAGQFFAQAKHMLELNWAPLVGGAVVSKKTWDTIPETARQAMDAAAAEAGRQIQARSRQESDEAVAAMKARGLTVHAVPPEIGAEWRKLSESAYPKIRGTMVPAEMFDEVVRLLKEYHGARK
jgi:TRAP-type C4-dicarboxylate transport system substrate-binding protein